MSNWTEDQKNAQIEDLPEVKNEGVEIPAKRHGCVTAWLILGLVVSAIGAIMGLGFSELITQLDGVDYLQPSYYIFTGVIAIVEFIGLLMIWKKRKWGFHVVVIAAMFNGTLGYLVNHEWLSFTTPFLNVFLLYMILQIAKGPHTAWSQLK
jgi:hypothetical protein